MIFMTGGHPAMIFMTGGHPTMIFMTGGASNHDFLIGITSSHTLLHSKRVSCHIFLDDLRAYDDRERILLLIVW